MKVVLAGGTGSLGRRIADDLALRGHEIVVLTRSARPDLAHRQVPWDGASLGPWASELADAAVVNLAGALVDRRPTAASIEMLTQSRVVPTQTLAAAARQGNTPLVWIQASTLAIYGDAGDAILDESSPPADGPPQMAGVASAWEAASEAVASHRKVVFRMGLVLDRDTPALQRLTALTRWGLGGRIGSGNQWISWIHISDFLAATRRALIDDALSGVIRVVGNVRVEQWAGWATDNSGPSRQP